MLFCCVFESIYVCFFFAFTGMYLIFINTCCLLIRRYDLWKCSGMRIKLYVW